MTNQKTKSEKGKGKNDIAWEALFERYPILDIINQQGYFEIEAATINQERESRLMAKFDHSVNLPQIFKEHHLSILPISRSKYVIGQFDTYSKVKYNDLEAIPIQFPTWLESIDYTHLYSEASAIICAYNTGIIEDLIPGEQPKLTIFGRMSSSHFDFKINNLFKDIPYSISVNNAQCEIDAGFESDNYLILIEAKNYKVDDFLVRQLYYPYRLWSSKINKKVVPVLMTYSNDTFSFFIYDFNNDLDYNSIQLIEQKNYIIAPETIENSDVSNIYDSLQLVIEPPDIPFPQANDFEKVVDMLTLLVNKDLTKDEITENYQFDQRQTNYYTDAGRYLGLINKYKANKKEITFCLTDEGKSILGKRHKIKYLLLIQKILEHEPFYKAFELTLSMGDIPSTEQIYEAIAKVRSDLNSTTINRRTSTVKRWIEWIWNQISKD